MSSGHHDPELFLQVFRYSYELKQQEHLFDQALLRITITVAVTMISIDTVIAIVTLTVTSVGLGLQIASYMNTKNDRPSSKR